MYLDLDFFTGQISKFFFFKFYNSADSNDVMSYPFLETNGQDMLRAAETHVQERQSET